MLSHNIRHSSNITKNDNSSTNISRGKVNLIQQYYFLDKFYIPYFSGKFHNVPCINLLPSLGKTYTFAQTTIIYIFKSNFRNETVATTAAVKCVYVCYWCQSVSLFYF